MYIAKIQKVTPDATDNFGPIFDAEPLKNVHNYHDDYNVFSNERQHPEQPKSINDTYLMEQCDTSINSDSSYMSNKSEEADQDDQTFQKECELLALLIKQPKVKVNVSKQNNKSLESSNKALKEANMFSQSELTRTRKLRNDILMFRQYQGESLPEAWIVSRTYYKKSLIMASKFGSKSKSFMTMSLPPQDKPLTNWPVVSLVRNVKESWALLEDLALYENKSWNAPRYFAKPVKAISLPKDVPSTSDHHLIELENKVQRLMQPSQVNKITSLCEICSVRSVVVPMKLNTT
nr:hypothetical protein [Tanacetum cinerariifolium]